jgi:hypothetical protein
MLAIERHQVPANTVLHLTAATSQFFYVARIRATPYDSCIVRAAGELGRWTAVDNP